ncbi:MAG: hypothetical protein ONB05_00210 [candidate division KSB1 bacterium]|nr:hypothetical protein [candidate division KSB1 bacterium]
MRIKQAGKLGVAGLAMVTLCLTEPNVWAVSKDRNPLAKPTKRDLRYIYARYEIPLTPDGRFGWDPEAQTPGGGRWLRGTDEGYIFGAGIWLGAIVDGSKQVTVGYNTMNCQTELVPGNLPNEPGYTDLTEIIYISTDYPNPNLPPWPKGYDKNGMPIVVSQMDSWSQCNDLDPSRQFEAGQPLGVLLTTETYSWNSSFRDVWDIAFIKYTVKNIRPDHKPWQAAYIGFAMDPDIGDPTNDLTGCFPDLNIGFAYSAAELSGLEKDLKHPPGYVGIKFLDGPAKDPVTGQAKMSSFRRWTTDPNTDEMRYNLLSQEYYDLEDTDPADKRIFLSSGPFDLAYGDSTCFVVAICFAWPQWYYDSSVKGQPQRYADYLKLVAQNAQFVYDHKFKFPQPPDLPRIQLIPQDQKIIITWDDKAEKTVEEILSLPDFSDSLDFEGYKLWKSTTGEEGSFQLLGQWDKVSFDDLGNPIGKNSGLVHAYVDENLVNGKVYFYAVTAYDKGEYQPLHYGDPEFEVVPPLETGMVFGINLKAESPNVPPSNFTPPRMEGLKLITGDPDDVSFGFSPNYLIPDSVKNKTFQILFSNPPNFRYDKEVTVSGPDIYVVDKTTGDTVSTTLNFPIGEPPTTLSSDLFNGMTLTFTGPNLLANRIDTVYFQKPKHKVKIHSQTAYTKNYLSPQTTVPLDLPYGAYFLPHTYLIEFYTNERVNVYDLNSGDTLDYQIREFGQGVYAIANFEKVVVSVNPVTGDTTWGWLNNPTQYKNRIYSTATGYKFYLPGAFIFIEDPGKEVGQGDSIFVKLAGVGAPKAGYVYQFSTQKPEVNYHTDLSVVKVVPNPYLVRAAWHIDNDDEKLQFINLPSERTNKMYTIAGDLVKTIRHQEPYRTGFDSETRGTAYWNLMTENNQKVATGIYIYYLDSPFGKTVGRFAVIR